MSKRRKKSRPQIVPINPKKYIREHARKLPIYQCLIRDDWETELFSPVIITRQKPNGNFIFCSYVVDLQCLGVKDVNFDHNMGKYDYDDMLAHYSMSMGLRLVEIDPRLCFNIIYAAVEFAEDCGFQPHKDFAVGKYLLDDVDEIEYMEIPVGKDGKPFFVAGPYDNSARIFATLKRTVGEGNFDYLMPFE
jgi:hypothetical protein